MKRLWITLLMSWAFPAYASVPGGFQQLDDEALGDIHGQAMFVSDYRQGAEGDGIDNNEFGFYRLMLNANLELNLNIDKLQLGCGGVNDGIAPGCDVDIDYFRMMGLHDGPGNNPNQPAGAGQAGNPVESLFSLVRPYVEFAVTNPDQPAFREIAGIKVGSQTARGFMSFGRYDPSLPGCSNPPNDPNCHMGINQFSGFMDARLQGDVDLNIQGCLYSGAPSWLCANLLGGDLSFDERQSVQGTRMNAPIFAIPASGQISLGWLGNIPIDIFSLFQADLRFIHGVRLEGSDDFFLSFQREPITYPAFEEGEWAAASANTGWWMNMPNIEVSDLQVGYTTNFVGAISSLFGTTQLVNYDVGQRPANNCWGAAQFC